MRCRNPIRTPAGDPEGETSFVIPSQALENRRDLDDGPQAFSGSVNSIGVGVTRLVPGQASAKPTVTEPGQHVVVVVPHVYEAYKGRYLGWELRDTFLILGAWGTLYAFLFRIPLQESTVAAQVLKTGTGGLWIDGCRVRNESMEHFRGESVTKQTTVSGDLRTGAALGMYGAGASFEPTNHPGGRWPPNLLLIHHPECRELGVKRLKGSNPVAAPRLTVASWDCHASCPVGKLDRQSGVLKSPKPYTYQGKLGGGFTNGDIGQGIGHDKEFGDTGGASRFYPQFGSLQECMDWLDRLINGPE